MDVDMIESSPWTKVPVCPTCGEEMTEDNQGEMSEGQEMEYEAGHNVPFSCSECGYSDLYNLERKEWYAPDDDDWEPDDQISADTVEALIERGITKRCFIEVLSLIHNVIELYLRARLRDHIIRLNTSDPDPKTGISTIDDEAFDKVEAMLQEHRYLKDFSDTCYALSLIKKEEYIDLKKFNNKRNKVIHDLLKQDKPGKSRLKYADVVEVAKSGRRLQLQISPLQHSPEEITRIVEDNFNVTVEEGEKDHFLKK